MTDEERKRKQQEEDKIRCANFLLQMFQKYGAKVRDKQKLKEKEAVISE